MCWAIHSVTEENLVKYVYVLSHWLIWVEGDNFTLDKSDSASCCCFKEVIVNLGYGSVSLHALNEILTWEVLNYLELFVPIVDLPWINSVQWHDSCAEAVRSRNSDLLLLIGEIVDPAVRGMCNWC